MKNQNDFSSVTKPCTLGKPDDKYCRMHEFFSKVPRDVYRSFLRDIENDGIKKVMNDEELRRTVEVFFHYDLNINEASKKLFVHRNTLIYRLDKIKRITGFDIKKFCDAFIFHVLMFSNY
ncbi:MAG: helix-turn-helix domain-containing protein [Firmicutes bacterium]|nr:helix-turn-helix domain-containing protein [Bacillota bacterium]